MDKGDEEGKEEEREKSSCDCSGFNSKGSLQNNALLVRNLRQSYFPWCNDRLSYWIAVAALIRQVCLEYPPPPPPYTHTRARALFSIQLEFEERLRSSSHFVVQWCVLG